MKTQAPSATNSLADARAMPDVAPVITATFPSSFFITIFSMGKGHCIGLECGDPSPL
jgi:hypothetical protein